MLSDPLKARGDHGTMKASAALGKLAQGACFVYLRRSLCRQGNCHLSLNGAVFKLWIGPHNLFEKKWHIPWAKDVQL